jgi:predicted membrane protein
MKGMKAITLFENILGLLVALLILFKILPSKSMCRELNTSPVIISYLIFLVVVFSVLNPIVGLLFLIYGYLIILEGKKEDDTRNQVLRELNPERGNELEETVIQSNDFTRIKNQFEDQVTRVLPVAEKLYL